jgi:hypothetical protein
MINEIQLLIEGTNTLRAELTKYEQGGMKWGECYVRLCTLECLLTRALLNERNQKAA